MDNRCPKTEYCLAFFRVCSQSLWKAALWYLVKNTHFGAVLPLPTRMWPWTTDLISLCFSVHIYKWGKWSHLPHGCYILGTWYNRTQHIEHTPETIGPVDCSHSSSICTWSCGLRAELETRSASPNWILHTQRLARGWHSKPSGVRDVKSTQDLSMRQIGLSFLCVPHCPCLVCVPSFKWHGVNVKKTSFWEWGGGCEFRSPQWDALCAKFPLPLPFCLSCKQANSLVGGIELPCLGFCWFHALWCWCSSEGAAGKDKPPFVFGGKNEKKEKKIQYFISVSL